MLDVNLYEYSYGTNIKRYTVDDFYKEFNIDYYSNKKNYYKFLKNATKLFWDSIIISKNNISVYFFFEFSNYLDWNLVIKHHKFNSQTLHYSIMPVIDVLKIHPYILSRYQSLSEHTMDEYSQYIDWDTVSKYQNLSEYFMQKYKNVLNWKNISIYQTLTENFIEHFSDKLDWNLISINQSLSEKFIKKHYNKVNWDSISEYQTLSEKFIVDNIDYICWSGNAIKLSLYQANTNSINRPRIKGVYCEDNVYSPDFLLTYQNHIDWERMSANKNLTEEIIDQLNDKICWKSLNYKHIKLSEPFIVKYKDKIVWNNIAFNPNMSKTFLNKFGYKISWDDALKNVELTKELILQNHFLLNKPETYRNKGFTEIMAWELYPMVNEKLMYTNKQFSEEFIKTNLTYSDETINYITKTQKLSEEFIWEYKLYFNWSYIKYLHKISPKMKLKLSTFYWIYNLKTNYWITNKIRLYLINLMEPNYMFVQNNRIVKHNCMVYDEVHNTIVERTC